MSLKYNRLHLFNIRFLLEELKGYVDYMESYIEQSIKDFDRKYDVASVDALKETDTEYYDYLCETLSEKWLQVNKTFPHNFRASFLTQIYSGFESQLVKICKHHHIRKKTAKPYEKYKGSEIGKASEYLIAMAGIDFADLQDDFDYIDQIRLVRNHIVHNQGKIAGNDRDWPIVYNFVKANKAKVVFNHDPEEPDDDGLPLHIGRPEFKFSFLIIDRQLNDELIVVVDRFFKKLLENEIS